MFVQIRREKEGEEGLFLASEIPSNLVWLYILFQTFCHWKAIVKITPEQLSRARLWGADWREKSSVERDMGILVGKVLNTSEQCALTMNASCILGFISKAVASRSTQAVIPPCLVLWDCIWRTVSRFGLSATDIAILEWVAQEAIKMAGGWSTQHTRRGWQRWVCSV